MEERTPGYLEKVKIFDYLDHPKIRKYVSKSIYYVSHIEEVRVHLRARIKSCNDNGFKGVAFTRTINDQKRIAKIVEEEGYIPLTLWSINNSEEMSVEQLDARTHILSTGLIPEPYNLLIINGAMQEGWNLYDESVTFSILNTVDETERVQALGRIRKDIDFVVYKSEDERKLAESVYIKDEFLNVPLSKDDKEGLCLDLGLLDSRGNLLTWRGLKILIEHTVYNVEEKILVIDGKRQRTSTITRP